MDASISVVVATVLFLLFVAKPISRAFSGGLNARAERIREELQEATRLKEEAQSLLASYQRKQNEIKAEAEDMIKSAKAEARHITKSAAEQLEKDLARRTENAAQKIATLEAQAVQNIQSRAVEITLDTTRELIVEHLGEKAADAVMADAVKDVAQKLH